MAAMEVTEGAQGEAEADGEDMISLEMDGYNEMCMYDYLEAAIKMNDIPQNFR